MQVFVNMIVRQEWLNEFEFGTDTSEMKRTATTHVLCIDVGFVMENKVKHVIKVTAVLTHPKKHIVNFENVLANDVFNRLQVIIVNRAKQFVFKLEILFICLRRLNNYLRYLFFLW